jgi:hypothetical protein
MGIEMEIYNRLIEASGNYIINSSNKASAVFDKLNMNFEFFEGTRMKLSPSLCESAYKDLILDMVKSGTTISTKYGLMAIIIPIRGEDPENIVLHLQLGIMFPDVETTI